MRDFVVVVGEISKYFTIGILILFIASWKKIPVTMRPMFWLFVVSVVCYSLSPIATKIYHNNLFIGSAFFVGQFALLYYVLTREMKESSWARILLIGYLSFFLINFIFIQGPLVVNSYSRNMGALIMIGLCLINLHRLLTDHATPIFNSPMFWVILGTLIFHAGTFFVFMITNYFRSGGILFDILWSIHNTLNLIKTVLFTVAIWQSYRYQRMNFSTS